MTYNVWALWTKLHVYSIGSSGLYSRVTGLQWATSSFTSHVHSVVKSIRTHTCTYVLTRSTSTHIHTLCTITFAQVCPINRNNAQLLRTPKIVTSIIQQCQGCHMECASCNTSRTMPCIGRPNYGQSTLAVFHSLVSRRAN